MGKPRKLFRAAIACAVIALILGTFAYLRRQGAVDRSETFPVLSFPDLDPSRAAGKADLVNGRSVFRTVLPEDFQSSAISVVPDHDTPEWTQLSKGSSFLLGTVFRVLPQASLQLMTTGNWLAVLDGDGEFILEDARTNADRTAHTEVWHVKRGQFRARHHQGDRSEHWLLIHTPGAKVLVHQGEIGLRVSEGGGGQVWLMSGEATVFWKDGRKRKLPVKGSDNL